MTYLSKGVDMKIFKDKNNSKLNDINILETLEFDLCEAIRDLIYSMKETKKEIDIIKRYLKLDR